MGNQQCVAAAEDEKPGALCGGSEGSDNSKPLSHSSSSKRSSSKKSVASIAKAPVKIVAHVVMGVASKIGHIVEHILYEDEPKEPVIRPRTVRGGVLLHGCDTPEEHFEIHDAMLGILDELQLKGQEGLQVMGLELRHVACLEHCSQADSCSKVEADAVKEEAPPDHDDSSVSDASQLGESTHTATVQHHCDDCVTRLFHKQSNVMIEDHNRKQFVSDGTMYDAVARLCMECAHETMVEEGNMQWVEIDGGDEKKGPIHALVSSTHPAAGGSDLTRPTLLVVTGKGKVRAGIFSRQHIITTGIEPSTGLFIIREAKKRNMNVVMLDPNVLGEREAYDVIEKSMTKIFSHIEQGGDETTEYPLFVQAHSAAGSHVVRYLLDYSAAYLPHIRAMAFTDSTHNIQWARKLPDLQTFLQSQAAVYFRSSKKQDSNCKSQDAGLEIALEKDEHWIRRFGKIRTCWAGTTEHSLTDWSARAFIWEHYDRHLSL